MPTREQDEAFRDAAKTAAWWKDKLGTQIAELSSALSAAIPEELAEDPFNPEPMHNKATPEQRELLERLDRKQQQLVETAKKLEKWNDSDPMGERLDAREQFLSTNPLMQQLRERFPNLPGFLREQELEAAHMAGIANLEDDIMEGHAKMPPPIQSLPGMLRHGITEASGWNLKLYGKYGERYPEEYMREKAEIYEGATKEYLQQANGARNEYFKLRVEQLLLETTKGGEPSLRQQFDAREKAHVDVRDLTKEIMQSLRNEKEWLHQQEQQNQNNPNRNNPFGLGPLEDARLPAQEADIALALSSAPPSIPRLAANPQAGESMKRRTVIKLITGFGALGPSASPQPALPTQMANATTATALKASTVPSSWSQAVFAPVNQMIASENNFILFGVNGETFNHEQAAQYKERLDKSFDYLRTMIDTLRQLAHSVSPEDKPLLQAQAKATLDAELKVLESHTSEGAGLIRQFIGDLRHAIETGDYTACYQTIHEYQRLTKAQVDAQTTKEEHVTPPSAEPENATPPLHIHRMLSSRQFRVSNSNERRVVMPGSDKELAEFKSRYLKPPGVSSWVVRGKRDKEDLGRMAGGDAHDR